MAGAGLQREDRRVRHQLDVGPEDLRRVRGEDDRAVHLRQLVQQRGRVVDVELDAARVEEGQLVAVADADQARRCGPGRCCRCPRAPRCRARPSRAPLRAEAPAEPRALRRHPRRTASDGLYAIAGKRLCSAGSRLSVSAAAARRRGSPSAARSAAREVGQPRSGSQRPRSRPNFAASASRRSGCATWRSSPVRPISPKAASGRLPAAERDALARREATASAMARSAPGSSTRTPPATETKTSARAERDAGVAGQHREHQREPVAVDAVGHPARRHQLGRRHERLDLDQQRPRALHRAEHHRARARGWPRRRTARRRPPPRPAPRRASRRRPPRWSSRSGSSARAACGRCARARPRS